MCSTGMLRERSPGKFLANFFFQLERNRCARGKRNYFVLPQYDSCRDLHVCDYWHSHRVSLEFGQRITLHPFQCTSPLSSCRKCVALSPGCHTFHFGRKCPAFEAQSTSGSHGYDSSILPSDRGEQRIQADLVDVNSCAMLLQQLQISGDLPTLRLLHRYLIIHKIERCYDFEKLLFYAYGRAGVAMDVLVLFLGFNEPDLVSWNLTIGLCARYGEKAVPFQLFANMQSQGHLPDQYSYSSILSVCCSAIDLHIIKQVHACIVASAFADDVVIATALVSMYGKCNSLDLASMAFASILRQDGVSWNAVIAAHAQHGNGQNAIQLYEAMNVAGFLPSKVTFTSILSACANVGALIRGIQLHAQSIGSGSTLNIVMATSLVNMYAKCGRMLNARHVFDCAPKEDAILWNAMISGYAQNGQGEDAFKIFEQMARVIVKPTKATFIAALEACLNETALTSGKQVHKVIKQYEYETDVVVGTALLTMYGRCGDLGDAFTVFDKLINRTIRSWNALIACYAQGGFASEVLQLFDQILSEGITPDRITYSNLLPACSNHASVADCKRLHYCVISSMIEDDDNLQVGLVNMYGRIGWVEDAEKIVYSSPRSRNVSAWTALIAAWSKNEAHSTALQCFYQMLLEGILPDKVAVITAFTVIASEGILGKGLHVHACIMASGLESEIDVQNALFSLYGKCGAIDAARTVFGRMMLRDTMSFKAMISVLLQFEEFAEAIDLFRQMLYEGLALDNILLATILNVCGNSGALTEGLKLHACFFYMDELLKVDDLLVGTAFLNMNASCGCLGSAWKVFKSLRVRDIHTWTLMMDACAFHGEGKATICLLESLQKEMLTPDRNTISKLLSGCNHAGLVTEANYTFHNMSKFYWPELHVDHFNCMVDLLGRAGQLDKSEEIVRTMPILPNAMSWSSLLSGCRLSRDLWRGELTALCLIELEPECVATYISLANIYAEAREMDFASLN